MTPLVFLVIFACQLSTGLIIEEECDYDKNDCQVFCSKPKMELDCTVSNSVPVSELIIHGSNVEFLDVGDLLSCTPGLQQIDMRGSVLGGLNCHSKVQVLFDCDSGLDQFKTCSDYGRSVCCCHPDMDEMIPNCPIGISVSLYSQESDAHFCILFFKPSVQPSTQISEIILAPTTSQILLPSSSTHSTTKTSGVFLAPTSAHLIITEV